MMKYIGGNSQIFDLVNNISNLISDQCMNTFLTGDPWERSSFSRYQNVLEERLDVFYSKYLCLLRKKTYPVKKKLSFKAQV